LNTSERTMNVRSREFGRLAMDWIHATAMVPTREKVFGVLFFGRIEAFL
jgi:hypothetical protein